MTQVLERIYKKFIAKLMLLTVEMILVLIVSLAAVIVFLLIAKIIFIDKHQSFDITIFKYTEGFINTRNNAIMAFFSKLGNFVFLVIANILLTAYYLFVLKNKWYSVKIPAIALSSVILMLLLKEWFSRPRPLFPLLEPAHGLSFPSGHAMSSVTFYGLIIYLMLKSKISAYVRFVAIVFLVLLILFIGISRIYLRVHYPTDVIAGFCVGVVWLIFSIFTLNKLEALSKRKIKQINSGLD